MSANPNVVPPSVKTKTDAPKTVTPPGVKIAKTPKVVDPNAPKKERGARQDYGFAKNAIIKVAAGEHKFKGQRGDWFTRLQASDGKTVQHFMDGNQGVKNNKGNPEPPRGWLRSFVADEVCALSGGTKDEPKAPAVKTDATPSVAK